MIGPPLPRLQPDPGLSSLWIFLLVSKPFQGDASSTCVLLFLSSPGDKPLTVSQWRDPVALGIAVSQVLDFFLVPSALWVSSPFQAETERGRRRPSLVTAL